MNQKEIQTANQMIEAAGQLRETIIGLKGVKKKTVQMDFFNEEGVGFDTPTIHLSPRVARRACERALKIIQKKLAKMGVTE